MDYAGIKEPQKKLQKDKEKKEMPKKRRSPFEDLAIKIEKFVIGE